VWIHGVFYSTLWEEFGPRSRAIRAANSQRPRILVRFDGGGKAKRTLRRAEFRRERHQVDNIWCFQAASFILPQP
jgi:hypothetical protein